jgi:hypothetical protein
MTQLYIVSGPMEGASTELKGEVTFIRRVSDNDIEIKGLYYTGVALV